MDLNQVAKFVVLLMASYKLVIEFSLIGEGVCQEKSNEVGDFKSILL